MPKFKTLEHNGVLLPEPYISNNLILASEPLSPLAEEMLYHFTTKLESVYMTNQKFIKNFYKCLKLELTEKQQNLIFPTDFEKIFETLKNIIQKRKEYLTETKEERKKISEENKEKYGFAVIDGIKQPVINYIVESPGIFITKGDSKILGLWKYRVKEEDIILNFVSKDKEPPKGNWKIEKNKNALHIASYYINIGNVSKKFKEVRLASNSEINELKEKEKFKKSKQLLEKWDEIQTKIFNDAIAGKEEAIISWLIQLTAIRVGNENDEKENVVGASTLKCKNIVILSETKFKLNFIGKDSVKFCEEYEVDKRLITALINLMKDKKDSENLFSVSSSNVNIYLNSLLEGLTAKVFRTGWASKILLENTKYLKKLDLKTLKKILLLISIKLNHKKTITEASKKNLEKLKIKLSELNEKLANEKNKTRKKKLKEKIKDLKEKIAMKKETLDVNLNTALSNYINPVLVLSLCKKFEIDYTKIYSKTLLKKIDWAIKLIFG